MQNFIDKTAVVTGGAGGMGLAIASALARRGADVRMLDKKPAPVLPKGKVEFMQGDVSNPDFVKKSFDGLTRLDFLVNAAGVLWLDKDKGLLEVDLDIWDQVMSINLKSMVLTMREAIPLMQAGLGGAIVNFSTIQCMRGDALPQDAYQASKAGVIALTKSVAIQYAKDGIRANSILPGPTESPMQDRWKETPGAMEATAASIPLGRVGTVEDMANACLFLLSDKSSFITGTELVVDGGCLAMP